MINPIDKILTEWAYRVHDGSPDPSNNYHLVQLDEYLTELRVPRRFREALLNRMRRLKEDDIVKNKKSDNIYVVKKHNKKTQDLVTPDASQDDIDNVKKSKDTTTHNKNINPANQKILDDFQEKIKLYWDDLSQDKQEKLAEAYQKIAVLYDDDASEEEKKAAAEWLVTEAKFTTNASGKKAYLNILGGNRKILSGQTGTVKSQDLVNQVKKYADVGSVDFGGVSQELTTAAKPDLGKQNEVKPKDSPQVDKFFREHKNLSRIREGLWGIFGVKDKNTGKIKMPSNEHSNEYLQQSFGNPALQNTINVANRLANEGKLDKGVVTALQTHQNSLAKIKPPEYDIPSEEAAQAIADSYNQMMVDLQKSDSDVASAVMKQLAENRLYEEELARGEEVYLPSNGSFPGGDKIKVDGLERVTLVSVKWGKSGRTYGCPANAKAVTNLHPDPNKRNNQGQYVGEPGHTLLINDDLVRGKNRKETVQKTENFIENALDDPPEVDLSDVFSPAERREIAKQCADHMAQIDAIHKKLKGVKPAEKYWAEFDKALRGSPDDPPAVGKDGKTIPKKLRRPSLEEQSRQKLGKIVTPEKVAALIGPNNVDNVLGTSGDNGISPDVLLGIIEIANNIRTGGGYGLDHNKQFYDEKGNPQMVTSEGTTNPDDYSITIRNHRTKGRSGGGIQLSFTGDGAQPNTNLQDDGSKTDKTTGLEGEI